MTTQVKLKISWEFSKSVKTQFFIKFKEKEVCEIK